VFAIPKYPAFRTNKLFVDALWCCQRFCWVVVLFAIKSKITMQCKIILQLSATTAVATVHQVSISICSGYSRSKMGPALAPPQHVAMLKLSMLLLDICLMGRMWCDRSPQYIVADGGDQHIVSTIHIATHTTTTRIHQYLQSYRVLESSFRTFLPDCPQRR